MSSIDLLDIFDIISCGDEHTSFVIAPLDSQKPIKDKQVVVSLKKTEKQVKITVEGKYYNKSFIKPLTNVPYQKIVDLHNQYVERYNATSTEDNKRAKILSLSDTDKKNIRGRWNHPSGKYASIEAWQDLFTRVEKSYYLMHSKSTKWFKGLKWFVMPENFSKLVAGNYDDENMLWFIEQEEREASKFAKEQEEEEKLRRRSKPDEMSDMEREIYNQLKKKRDNEG